MDYGATIGYNVFMPKRINAGPAHFSVREAKNRFSELVRLAAQGRQITITLHGEPRARLGPVVSQPRPFAMDRKWLLTMKVSAL